MKESYCTFSSIPNDIARKIASSLKVADISSLSCCSRVCHEIWGYDCLWEPLFKERWPLLYDDVLKDPNFKGWKEFYMEKHKEMSDQAESVIKFVKRRVKSESLEVQDHLKAIECLKLAQFGLKDVQIFLFKPKLNVLLNLVGLHYCLNILHVPGLFHLNKYVLMIFFDARIEQASDVVEALEKREISDSLVCVKWRKLGRLPRGIRMGDELYSRCVSLKDLATSKDEGDILEVLDRGVVDEVLQVQISIVDFKSYTWATISSS